MSIRKVVVVLTAAALVPLGMAAVSTPASAAAGCRVVYTVGGPSDANRFGFAYGTLTNHAESGEELFEVWLDPRTNQVHYRIRAISWPQATFARIGQPVARALQQRFRDDSAAAMKRATRGDRLR